MWYCVWWVRTTAWNMLIQKHKQTATVSVLANVVFCLIKWICPCICQKGMCSSAVTTVLIHEFSTWWNWMISFRTQLLWYLWYPLSRHLGGPQRCYRHKGEDKSLLLLPGIKPWFLTCPDHSVVTIPTALSWLPLRKETRLGCTRQALREVEV